MKGQRSMKKDNTKTLKEKRPKPQYNMAQNTAYMIAAAWETRKSVLWCCLLVVFCAIGLDLVNLFTVPTILARVETAAPLPDLLLTIFFFASTLILLKGLNAYVDINLIFGRVEIRLLILRRINCKLATISYPYTENEEVNKKLETARGTTNDNSKATEAIWETLTGLLHRLIGFAIYLFLMSALNPILILLTVVLSVMSFFLNRKAGEWNYKHRDEESKYERAFYYVNNEARDVKLAKDIRIFGMRGWLEDMQKSALDLYAAFVKRRENFLCWIHITNFLMNFLRSGLIYFYLIRLTVVGGLPASSFLLYFTAVGTFTGWISGILSDFNRLHEQSLGLSAVREYLDYPEIFRFEEGKALEPIVSGAYEIKLENLSFRYPGAEDYTIKNLNLTIHPSEKLAIVGLNGAGKTTLIKLLCGFYDPTEGRVLLNGQDIRQYNRRDYYRHFTAVFQQFSLLDVTLAENVTQDAAHIDEQKVWNCLEKAGLTEKVKSLPQGLNTHIGREVFEDGIYMSGGETQRLILARALYKDAPIVVLDEPTAALDPLAENDLYQKYSDLTDGRTSLYISHRLASTRFCDRILYLEKGVIAEEGSHDELLKRGGKYADLFEIQSRYYKEGVDICEEAQLR